MNYSGIIYCDPANGVGIRVTIFVSGCIHNCPECHNPSTHDFNYGEPWTSQSAKELDDYFKRKPQIKGLTISGGDPLHPANIDTVKSIVEIGVNNNRNIWVYSGYTWEQLLIMYKDNLSWQYILNHIDVLVDGKFILRQKDMRLLFRGSSNQRLIDVKNTLRQNKIVLWDNERGENNG